MLKKEDNNKFCDYGLIVNKNIEGIVDPNKGKIYFDKDLELLKNLCNSCEFGEKCSKETKDKIFQNLI